MSEQQTSGGAPTIRSGKRREPDKVLLVGTEGIGKSTFGACAPSPIFIPTEDGLAELDVHSFEKPKTFDDVMGHLRWLGTADHQYRTLVIDTVDALEPLVWAHVCTKNGWRNIEEPGYGKGYVVADDMWRTLLSALDFLRVRKGLEIILIAHAAVANFTNPAGADYCRYSPKLHKRAMALVKEWVKSHLFAVHEEFVDEKKKKANSTGERLIHTERTSAWDAKNRYRLPPELPLDYSAYAAAREAYFNAGSTPEESAS